MIRQATREDNTVIASADTAPTVTIPPYLSGEQLAAVTPWTVDAIEKMIGRGLLVRGVHFFQPFGRRSQRIFKWEAILMLIEGGAAPSDPRRVIVAGRVRGRGQKIGQIDVEKATAELQRLLR